MARHPGILGYFAGHTHRNRVRHIRSTGDRPWVEVACVKDYPGTWAEYRVHERGVLQVHRRISTPAALAWSEQHPRHVRRHLRRVRAGASRGPLLRDGPVTDPGPRVGPLRDLRVLDLATVIAGPGAARYLADYGADVLKVERPGVGDSTRGMGTPDPRDGVAFYWKIVARNKRCVTIDLKAEAGRALLLDLVESAQVLVENFRPGTLERLGLGPDVLLARNPGLVILRVTGFGQDGPYAGRAGFATIAEAMSGFAALNGEPEGGPLLPPIALTDEVTALVGAFATMVALHSGVGQVVDVNLLESLFQCMGPLASAFVSTGYLQPRLGSGIPYSVPARDLALQGRTVGGRVHLGGERGRSGDAADRPR